jgi:sulfoxide reductase heme-binding subunit YedZ
MNDATPIARALPASRPVGGRAGGAKDPWWRDRVALSKPLVVALGLLPIAQIAYAIAFDPDRLGANPAEFIEHATGDWALQFLLITLAVSPLRRITGWNALIRYRRMLGLFAFFYGVVHLACYVSFDRVFDLGEIAKDIVKRPYITVGFAALVLMTPLAVTSTKGWIRRLGGQNWNRLHMAIYPVAVLGVLHYWWLVKRDITWPAIYAVILVVLLGYRLWLKLRPRGTRRATRAPA